MKAALYWRTVRHLKVRQLTGRVAFAVSKPSPDLRPAPVPRPARAHWVSPEWREPALSDAGTAQFLNVCAPIGSRGVWQDRSLGHLWLFNLHYFDDLTARGARTRRPRDRAFITRWISENPPPAGVGWEPYPVSLRPVNWIKWLLTEPADGQTAGSEIHDSLAVQARWLSRRLEFHLLGNHLWANAKGLFVAGLYFDGPEADEWRGTALRILEREVREQILADGGHFERSPMYHAILLEDMLDLLQFERIFPGAVPSAFAARLRDTAERMLRWLRVMTHPDGGIALFNDAALDIAAPLAALDAYARAFDVAPGDSSLEPIEWLRDSGYVRMTTRRASVFCDVAPLGPDYQLAHAHADTLSFELSLDGKRVIVNGGTSTYAPGPERTRQRGTAAHSTVEVDGRDSSEVWASFRVARRARPLEVAAGSAHDGLHAMGAHDGYASRGVRHHRSWTLGTGGLDVRDELTGSYRRAVARFILHPSQLKDQAVDLEASAATRRVPASWHPRFGVSVPTEAVEVNVADARAETRVRWR